MTQKSITIKASLDARQAAYFVQTAGKFRLVWMKKELTQRALWALSR